MGLQLEGWESFRFTLSSPTNSFISEQLEGGLNVFPENCGFAQDKSLKGSLFNFFFKWALLLMPYL